MSHGVKAVSVDSHTPLRQRERALDDFRCGRVAVMVNVELFTEGLDCPSVQIVVLARPTRSLAMYMQQVGRALRPLPGGGRIVILDVAGLYARFGLPDRQRNWQGCFAGAPYSGERYRQPLGSISSLPASLMMRVERKAGYASVQPQGLAWQIGCNERGSICSTAMATVLWHGLSFADCSAMPMVITAGACCLRRCFMHVSGRCGLHRSYICCPLMCWARVGQRFLCLAAVAMPVMPLRLTCLTAICGFLTRSRRHGVALKPAGASCLLAVLPCSCICNMTDGLG